MLIYFSINLIRVSKVWLRMKLKWSVVSMGVPINSLHNFLFYLEAIYNHWALFYTLWSCWVIFLNYLLCLYVQIPEMCIIMCAYLYTYDIFWMRYLKRKITHIYSPAYYLECLSIKKWPNVKSYFLMVKCQIVLIAQRTCELNLGVK